MLIEVVLIQERPLTVGAVGMYVAIMFSKPISGIKPLHIISQHESHVAWMHVTHLEARTAGVMIRLKVAPQIIVAVKT
jgi:hypothetical protein